MVPCMKLEKKSHSKEYDQTQTYQRMLVVSGPKRIHNR